MINSRHYYDKRRYANTASSINHTSLMMVVWLKFHDKVTIHKLHTEFIGTLMILCGSKVIN